jgi:hypothetical protein
VERVVLNALEGAAALPPNICAFGDPICHRLEDKTIHLWRAVPIIVPAA